MWCIHACFNPCICVCTRANFRHNSLVVYGVYIVHKIQSADPERQCVYDSKCSTQRTPWLAIGKKARARWQLWLQVLKLGQSVVRSATNRVLHDFLAWSWVCKPKARKSGKYVMHPAECILLHVKVGLSLSTQEKECQKQHHASGPLGLTKPKFVATKETRKMQKHRMRLAAERFLKVIMCILLFTQRRWRIITRTNSRINTAMKTSKLSSGSEIPPQKEVPGPHWLSKVVHKNATHSSALDLCTWRISEAQWFSTLASKSTRGHSHHFDLISLRWKGLRMPDCEAKNFSTLAWKHTWNVHIIIICIFCARKTPWKTP